MLTKSTSLRWQDIAALKDPSTLPFLHYYVEVFSRQPWTLDGVCCEGRHSQSCSTRTEHLLDEGSPYTSAGTNPIVLDGPPCFLGDDIITVQCRRKELAARRKQNDLLNVISWASCYFNLDKQ